MIDHLSQTHHQCLMMERDEQLCLYFDCALEKVSEGNVMEAFTQSLNDITPKFRKVFYYDPKGRRS